MVQVWTSYTITINRTLVHCPQFYYNLRAEYGSGVSINLFTLGKDGEQVKCDVDFEEWA